MNHRKTPFRRPPKILYQFHHSDFEVFEVRAMTLKEAVDRFKQQHGNVAVHEILLVGRRGQWVPVSPDILRGAA